MDLSSMAVLSDLTSLKRTELVAAVVLEASAVAVGASVVVEASAVVAEASVAEVPSVSVVVEIE
jgi:hypothetical protein